MNFKTIYTKDELHQKAQSLFSEERNRKRLDGWFIAKETARECDIKFKELPLELKSAETLREIMKCIPISISNNAVFAGTQNDAFARSYALINPSFRVDSFTGYCDIATLLRYLTTLSPTKNFQRKESNLSACILEKPVL